MSAPPDDPADDPAAEMVDLQVRERKAEHGEGRGSHRRDNRTLYDAEATVAAFTDRLRDAVEIDAIRRFAG